jgi:hypothetical protein
MDQIYFWIVILFLIVLILDIIDKYYSNSKEKDKKKKEDFNNWNNIPRGLNPLFYEENKLVTYEPPYTTNALNFNSNCKINFKNFGTHGVTPPYVKCPTCDLQFDCSNFPYDVDSNFGSVCTKCNEKLNFDKNNLLVYARSNGKPRSCNKLL